MNRTPGRPPARASRTYRSPSWLSMIAAGLVALAMLAAGCSSRDDPPATPTPAASPAATAAPVATPAPAGTRPADPSATYFDLERVLRIAIEIAPEDWETLRHQTRTLEDLIAEIEEYGLSRPFADIYTWFPATVSVDGETHAEVGVRKKGFIGSQSDTRPRSSCASTSTSTARRWAA